MDDDGLACCERDSLIHALVCSQNTILIMAKEFIEIIRSIR
jgi:hypothetical protein